MIKNIDNKQANKDSSISRRKFLSGISKAAAAIPFIQSTSLFDNKTNDEEKIFNSKVTVIRRENATSDNTINQKIVQEMFDENLKTLTNKKSTSDAWESILPNINPSKEIISLKINCISRQTMTHKEVTYAITNSLIEFGLPANNIIIWDRTDRELEQTGYKINSGDTGVRCFGTDHPGIGYDKKVVKLPAGVNTSISRILTEYTDYLINVPVLKNHGGVGVTLCLKNHFGTFRNPSSFHGSKMSNIIPELNVVPEVSKKTVLFVADALYGVARGGPGGPPTFTYNGLILGFDPVAIDYYGMKILEEYNCPTIDIAEYISLASKRYGIGNSDPKNIQIIEI